MSLRPLMVLGTSSHAGKSLLAAGFGRLFADAGLRVAPFKAQNMSLNSFVTADGGEIARAQVVQAEACGVEPHTDMNPILLKPMRDGCQVIADGRPIGHMSTLEYYARKRELWGRVTAAFDRLKSENDLVVLEGAGSPVEVNLRDTDLVNLAMAEYADASCVIVADIERGGVFAQIVGTWELLEPAERERVVGWVINKFRGTRSLLDSGLDFIRERTGRPVLGVLPFDDTIQLDEEDSLGLGHDMGSPDADIDVVVIRLPGISNFTDFWSLARVPRVRVRFVHSSFEWGRPDLVIVPGTRTTADAIKWLTDFGLDERLQSAAADPAGPLVLGICGGYQLLGSWINDRLSVESDRASVAGLGLLRVTTEFRNEKTLHRVRGHFCPGTPFSSATSEIVGYEVHMGETIRGPDVRPLIEIERTRTGESLLDGAVDDSGRVFGTYVHGLFDSANVAWQLVSLLRERRGLAPLGSADSQSHREFQASRYARLANFLREHLDFGLVSASIGISSIGRGPVTTFRDATQKTA